MIFCAWTLKNTLQVIINSIVLICNIIICINAYKSLKAVEACNKMIKEQEKALSEAEKELEENAKEYSSQDRGDSGHN